MVGVSVVWVEMWQVGWSQCSLSKVWQVGWSQRSLSEGVAAFVSFHLLRRRHVCFRMHLDVCFGLSSLLFSPSSASRSFI